MPTKQGPTEREMFRRRAASRRRRRRRDILIEMDRRFHALRGRRRLPCGQADAVLRQGLEQCVEITDGVLIQQHRHFGAGLRQPGCGAVARFGVCKWWRAHGHDGLPGAAGLGCRGGRPRLRWRYREEPAPIETADLPRTSSPRNIAAWRRLGQHGINPESGTFRPIDDDRVSREPLDIFVDQEGHGRRNPSSHFCHPGRLTSGGDVPAPRFPNGLSRAQRALAIEFVCFSGMRRQSATVAFAYNHHDRPLIGAPGQHDPWLLRGRFRRKPR